MVDGGRSGCGERARLDSHLAGRSEDIRRQSDASPDAYHHVRYSPGRQADDILLRCHHLQVSDTIERRDFTLRSSLRPFQQQMRWSAAALPLSLVVGPSHRHHEYSYYRATNSGSYLHGGCDDCTDTGCNCDCNRSSQHLLRSVATTIAPCTFTV